MDYNPGLPITEANSLPVHNTDGAGSTIGTSSSPMVSRIVNRSNIGSGLATYVATGVGYTAYATPTDMLAITGSATKTILVTNLQLQLSATATSQVMLYFIKRSTANTGGTPTNPSAIAYDSTNGAATAVITTYGSAPTLGNSAGTIYTSATSAGAATGTPTGAGLAIGNTRDIARSVVDIRQPITLRGTGEMLCLNFGSAAIPAGFSVSWIFEWAEV